MIVVEGTVEEVIFTNEVNGYTVCDIRVENDVVTAVGYMPFVNAGENVKLIGKWVTHPDYGEQLKVEAFEKVLPQSADGMEKYLASGVIKGIGPATAAKIVKRFSENTLNIIQFHPEQLSEIKGISLDKALRIGQAFQEQAGLRNVIMFFQEYGISPSYSTKIYKVFGEGTIEKIKENPYRLADEIFGIGFKTADKIAGNMGVDPLSKYRLCSGIKYILSQAASNGHTYLLDEKVKELASQLLDINIDDIKAALISLTIDKAVFIEKGEDGNRVYLSAFYQAELNICKKLAELSLADFEVDLTDFEKIIGEVQCEEGIILAEKQKIAVREAMSNGILVITGGPGTGKTTIIKSIIKLLDKEGYEVVLAAPTGRAAKRMSEATGFEAKTIHRLLEIGYSGSESELVFQRSEANPIDADVVIIDEMSMVDILLMNNLLKAVVPGTRLILVGDVDQLPSVGAGNVLNDIIASGMIKTVKLTEIFRQAEESLIVVNAHRINKGEYPLLNVKEKDFFFVQRGRGEEVVKTIVDLCVRRLPDSYGYDPIKHIQVLTPMKKGTVGVLNINTELQRVLNPEDKIKKQKVFRDFIFREGDRIMQTKNNYNLRWKKVANGFIEEGEGIFNGDTGIIKSIDEEEQRLIVFFDDDKVVEYDYSILDELDPAFAITIHKSQGSEFPVVILPIFPGPQVLMTRNLLYTAITRAKSLVILVGVENTLHGMIENQRETLRLSGLVDKLRKCIGGL